MTKLIYDIIPPINLKQLTDKQLYTIINLYLNKELNKAKKRQLTSKAPKKLCRQEN